MKTIIQKIYGCYYCPHFVNESEDIDHECVYIPPSCGLENNKILDNDNCASEIPKWCPLPD